MTSPQTPSWRSRLEGQIEAALEDQIEVFETQIDLKRHGRLDDKIFAETRLRRGVYGQRYDNGKRHDGRETRQLAFPCGEGTKGPNTVWDAPGMLRIKIPFGALNTEQLEVLADLAEEYSDGICHVTTRQDIQYHFIHLDDTPDIMRRLGAVGITTQEACGNSVRNITACPLSGVCNDETFDVSPYAHALTHYLMGHKDTQDFGRKVKIAFSGCAQHACGLANMHDFGLVARTREENGEARRGFEFYVGGGLGAVPHQAKLLSDFVPEEELLPTAQAVCRIFARLGEKKNRARARIKFLVAKVGIEDFRTMVADELATIPEDERWTAYLDDLDVVTEKPSAPGQAFDLQGLTLEGDERQEFLRFLTHNTQSQRQPGYSVVTVALPLGDFTSRQTRALADIARRFNGGHVRLTVDQNVVFRFIAQNQLANFWAELKEANLASVGAGTLVDVTSCPGTDTCKLGISSSRGLASELRRQAQEGNFARDEAVQSLRIKISGCFNSCGQHHVADLGFYGVSRKHEGRAVPHFQVVVGGQWENNAGSYGLAIVAVPSKRIPDVVERLTQFYLDERDGAETFQAFVQRVGKAEVRGRIQDLTLLPSYEEQPHLFSDWRDPREYTIGDMGVGECAGEVVSVVEFGLAASERKVFEAQIRLDEGDPQSAADQAYQAMVQAAKALARWENIDVTDEPQHVVDEFRTRYYDTEKFFDPFAGAKFANYLFAAHDEVKSPTNGANGSGSSEKARQRIEEAQLFIEAAHSCYQRVSQQMAEAAQ